MTLKQMALVLLGLASGVISVTLLDTHQQPEVTDGKVTSRPHTVLAPTPAMPTLRPEPSPRAASLKVDVSTSDQEASVQDLTAKQGEGSVESGISEERMRWIRQRAGELRKLREQAEIERKQRGEPRDANAAIAFMYDPDLDLREEIGEQEYAAYRQALGRPMDVEVVEVRPGSSAEKVGILPGDRVISYGGRRVFSAPDLDGMSVRNMSGPVIVELERDGQTLQVMLPQGATGIRGPSLSLLPFPPSGR